MPAIALDDLPALREVARREAGPFVDPTRLRTFQNSYPAWPAVWVRTVLGLPANTPYPSPVTMCWSDVVALLIAADLDPGFETVDPALAAADDAAREARRAEREADEARVQAEATARAADWAALRTRLPVPVIVGHLQHSRPYSGFQHGGEHIVVQERLTAGRIVREPFTALCETPSRPLGYSSAFLERCPEEISGAEHPYPSCKECLRVADRISIEEASRGGFKTRTVVT